MVVVVAGGVVSGSGTITLSPFSRRRAAFPPWSFQLSSPRAALPRLPTRSCFGRLPSPSQVPSVGSIRVETVTETSSICAFLFSSLSPFGASSSPRGPLPFDVLRGASCVSFAATAAAELEGDASGDGDSDLVAMAGLSRSEAAEMLAVSAMGSAVTSVLPICAKC